MRKAKIKSFQNGKYEFKEDVIFHKWTDSGFAIVEKADRTCGVVYSDEIKFLTADENFRYDLIESDKRSRTPLKNADSKDLFYSFNINETVKVKLNDLGYQHLADIHNRYVGRIPSFEKRNLDYYKNKADKLGYTEFQLWSFMEDFGETVNLGDIAVFETLIQINSKHLQKL